MLKKEDIKMVIEAVRSDWAAVSEKDIAFAILYDVLEDKSLAYRMSYHKSEKDAKKFYDSPRFRKLRNMLEPLGVGTVNDKSITREENKAELFKMLSKIEQMFEEGTIDAKDALKMQADIRVKLNDKFDMEESQKPKRIIVVPSKHDVVCPTTNRECNFWPTKKACIKHFGLIDPSESEEKTNNNLGNEQETV